MTKAQVVEHLFEKVGFSKKDSSDVVEMILETIKDALIKGEKVKISGFGNFVVKEKKARRGRNPQTGDDLTISARRVLTFKPSQVLKSAINAGD